MADMQVSTQPYLHGPVWRVALIGSSMLGLIWILFARMLGPSDLWDQTQPKTISYTTDIVVHGGTHWILPLERGAFPATKPPLYNWFAAPMVKLLGFGSEVAHKFPSIMAICLCWLALVRLGRRLDASNDGLVGWLAGLALVACYPMFKLGYLARPDMLLVLWMFLAWIASTAVLADAGRLPDETPRLTARSRRWLVAAFWTCIALAGLTKGPAALAGVLYIVIAARILTGSWRSVGIMRPVSGFAFALMINAAWLAAVWRINADHLYQELWYNEIYGRVTGVGPEGNRKGPRGWFIDLPNQLLYYVVRFMPWSLCSFAAMAVLWQQRSKASSEDSTTQSWKSSSASRWLYGAAIFVIIVIGLFTLSTGKRADYIAIAIPQGALLAAWWLLQMDSRLALRQPWLAPTAAVVVLSAMTIVNQAESSAPIKGFGDAINQFAQEAGAIIRDEPLPVAYFITGELQLQAMIGTSVSEERRLLFELFDGDQPFWLVAGRHPEEPRDPAERLGRTRQAAKAHFEPLVRSAVMSGTGLWPEQVTLYRVTPGSKQTAN